MSRGSRGTRYGGRHERIRRAELARWVPGQSCALCGKPTWQKGRLHLAHKPGSDTDYAGLAHIECNLSDAGKLTDYHGRSRPADPDPKPWLGFD